MYVHVYTIQCLAAGGHSDSGETGDGGRGEGEGGSGEGGGSGRGRGGDVTRRELEVNAGIERATQDTPGTYITYTCRVGNNSQTSDIFMLFSDQRTIWSAIMSEQ